MPTPSYEEIAEALYEVSKTVARELDPHYNYSSWEDLSDAEQDVNIAAAKIVFGTIEDRRVAEVVARDIQANQVDEEVLGAVDEAARVSYAEGALNVALARLLATEVGDDLPKSFDNILIALWNQAYNAGVNDLLDDLFDDCELD